MLRDKRNEGKLDELQHEIKEKNHKIDDKNQKLK